MLGAMLSECGDRKEPEYGPRERLAYLVSQE
jgi:hypothetical protein